MEYSDRARSFVDEAHEEYTWSRDEQDLLHEIAGVMTTIDFLVAESDGAPATVKGSTGQVRANPIFSEIRAERALLAKLLTQLGIAAIDRAEEEEAALRAATEGTHPSVAVKPHRWDRDQARAAGRKSGVTRRGGR